MPQLAVFDLDGTFVDTPRAIVETFTATFTSLGVEEPDPGAVRATIGLPLEQAFGQLRNLPPEHEQVTKGVRQYQIHFKELILPRAPELLFPGVADGLDTLRDHFAEVVGADQVTRPKPHPESGLLILDALGVPAGQAVMVGDTTHDLKMAQAVGMRSIAVTYGNGIHGVAELATAEPTWTVDTFDEVVKLLGVALPSVVEGPAA